jgi:type II protein arginine methyltransferase
MQPVDATNQALHHVQQGRSSSDLRDHTKSFWHFLQALTLVPQLLDVLENEMVVAVKGAAAQNPPNTATLYKYGISVVGEHSTLLHFNYASYLCSIGKFIDGMWHFRKSLHIQPSFLAARESLDNLLNYAVDRWHFRMLNDTARNSAFDQAIQQVVKELSESNPGKKVTCLDIGAGTGLLSMMAIRAGACHAYGGR